MLIFVYFGNLWVNKIGTSFLQQLDLKIKIKHRYNYTDSVLMSTFCVFCV